MLGKLNLFCSVFIFGVIIFKFLVIMGKLLFRVFFRVWKNFLLGVGYYLLFLVVFFFWGIF